MERVRMELVLEEQEEKERQKERVGSAGGMVHVWLIRETEGEGRFCMWHSPCLAH